MPHLQPVSSAYTAVDANQPPEPHVPRGTYPQALGSWFRGGWAWKDGVFHHYSTQVGFLNLLCVWQWRAHSSVESTTA